VTRDTAGDPGEARKAVAELALDEQVMAVVGPVLSAESEDAAAEAELQETPIVTLTRAEGMRKLISDLLDLTRIESGQKRRDIVDLDVREIARAAIESFAPAARARNIALELHAPDPLPMPADRGEITRFFDKDTEREWAAGPCNRLAMFKDTPVTFDAWDIDTSYNRMPVALPEPDRKCYIFQF
jgi:hypothetical protein